MRAHVVLAVLVLVLVGGLGGLGGLAGLAGCGGSGHAGPTLIPAANAAPLPPLAYHLLGGAPWSSADVAGRVLVIDVWATYCKPCRAAFPKLNKLAAAHPDAAVIGLSLDEDDAVVRAFLAQVPAAYPIARDPQLTVQTGPLRLAKLPTLLVVDRRGRLRLRAENLEESDYDALPGLVTALLAE